MLRHGEYSLLSMPLTCYNHNMKFSKEWLQSYIVETLPDDEVIDDNLSKKAFEVESITTFEFKTKGDNEKSSDTIYDIKVLPNRQGDALSHYYTAKEICAILGFTLKPLLSQENNLKTSQVESNVENKLGDSKDTSLIKEIPFIKIENPDDCRVFMSLAIDGVDNRPSPDWMRRRLESIGQKSINAIVDITNYVQFAINKPMHAYDARSVVGGFVIRKAKEGETLRTLVGDDLKLGTQTLIIADHEKPLGLAGIKGGIYSGVSDSTKSIILESANFNSILIRKTSKKYNIRTDASKRFEAGQSDTLVSLGIDMAIDLFKEIFGPDIVIGEKVMAGSIDNSFNKVSLSLSDINNALGTNYKSQDIEKALTRYTFKFDKNNIDNKSFDDKSFITNKNIVSKDGQNATDNIEYLITIPSERVDLRIEVDLIDEIARNIGYDNLPRTLPTLNRLGAYDNPMYIEMKARQYLFSIGYDEVITYTLTHRSDIGGSNIEIESNGASIYLRNDLSKGLLESYNKNISNAPIMELTVIRAYEIGSVFTKDNETRHLAIVCDDNKKKTNYKEEMESIIKDLCSCFNLEKINYTWKSDKPAILEIDLTELLDKNLEFFTNVEKDKINLDIDHNKDWKYSHISAYPIVTRDVACYYPDTLSIESMLMIISKNINLGPSPSLSPQGRGEEIHDTRLARKYYLVDKFDRAMEDGTVKHSAAFRIVYQSDDRTLTDEEVNLEVDKVYQALKLAGCELR